MAYKLSDIYRVIEGLPKEVRVDALKEAEKKFGRKSDSVISNEDYKSFTDAFKLEQS